MTASDTETDISPEWASTRRRVKEFVEQRIYPVEDVLHGGDRTAANLTMSRLMDEAKAAGLWALGHPREIGGQGMPLHGLCIHQ